jgi:hypothetical protein
LSFTGELRRPALPRATGLWRDRRYPQLAAVRSQIDDPDQP